jgi:16S rRNA (cytosine967-C5)-methyltransferase
MNENKSPSQEQKAASHKKSNSSGVATRAVAIDALTHVLTRNYHSDSALDKLFQKHPNFSPLDKSFVFEMVYGTLRWLSKLDWILQHMIDRPFVSLDARVANALRVGAYQIYYMDKVPDRASVSETVEAVRLIGASNAVSFVNAILRRVSRKGEYFAKPSKETHLADYLAMHFAHPKWLVERWLERFPEARVIHMLEGNNKHSKFCVRELQRNRLPEHDGQPDTLGNYLLRNYNISSSTTPLKKNLVLSKYPPFKNDKIFQMGCFQVQDEAAQLIALLVKPSAADFLLDACSAPGGKTIQLWDEGIPASQIVVCDSSQKRLKILEQNFERVGLKGVRILNCDATAAELSEIQFAPNKILVDAPCSSLGVIRRHPEIKWLRSLQDILRCGQEQLNILCGVAPKLQIGGEMIYSVCSNEKEETSDVIEQFLLKNKNFEKVDLWDRVHDYYKKYVFHSFEFSILPGNQDDLDGFYGVILKKNYEI